MNIKNEIAKIQKSALTDPRFKKIDGDLEITDNALDGVNKLFNSILPHFPAWRQSCPTDDDLSRLKLVWTKALMRNKQSTGKTINLKAGITACEESDTDWMPSVGKFIKWCDQSDKIFPLAQRALDLFNSAQKQIDSVGKMVVSKHSFNLKQLKAADTNKQFTELYLSYAENNAIESLDTFALTKTVQLSKEQQKDADNRATEAREAFFDKFRGNIDISHDKSPKKASKGIVSGSLGIKQKTLAQDQEEIRRQISALKQRFK